MSISNYHRISNFRRDQERKAWNDEIRNFAKDVEETIRTKRAGKVIVAKKGRDITPPTREVRDSWTPFVM